VGGDHPGKMRNYFNTLGNFIKLKLYNLDRRSIFNSLDINCVQNGHQSTSICFLYRWIRNVCQDIYLNTLIFFWYICHLVISNIAPIWRVDSYLRNILNKLYGLFNTIHYITKFITGDYFNIIQHINCKIYTHKL
jgi:hypothetical protein